MTAQLSFNNRLLTFWCLSLVSLYAVLVVLPETERPQLTIVVIFVLSLYVMCFIMFECFEAHDARNGIRVLDTKWLHVLQNADCNCGWCCICTDRESFSEAVSGGDYSGRLHQWCGQCKGFVLSDGCTCQEK